MTARSCPVCSVIDEHPAGGFWYKCTACGTRFRPTTAVDTETYPKPYRNIVRQRDTLLAACEELCAAIYLKGTSACASYAMIAPTEENMAEEYVEAHWIEHVAICLGRAYRTGQCALAKVKQDD